MSYFLNTDEIVQTIRMIEQEHLDNDYGVDGRPASV